MIKKRSTNNTSSVLTSDVLHNVSLGVDNNEEISTKELVSIQREMQKIDLEPLKDVNLDRFPELKSRFKEIKRSNNNIDFTYKVDNFIDALRLNDNDWESKMSILKFVMNEVESFILLAHSGDIKKALVIDVCKKYFGDNEKLLSTLIDLIIESKGFLQMGFLKRLFLRLKRYFKNTQPVR